MSRMGSLLLKCHHRWDIVDLLNFDGNFNRHGNTVNYSYVTIISQSMTVIAARIRRMREGNIYSLFALAGGGTLSQVWIGGGDTPSQVWTGGGTLSQVQMGGVPHPRSRWGGVPNLLMGGYPHSRSGWRGYPGVPPIRTGWVTPSKTGMGTPLSRTGWGTPPSKTGWGTPIRRQISKASTCYASGGVLLASMQEDFLVKMCILTSKVKQIPFSDQPDLGAMCTIIRLFQTKEHARIRQSENQYSVCRGT